VSWGARRGLEVRLRLGDCLLRELTALPEEIDTRGAEDQVKPTTKTGVQIVCSPIVLYSRPKFCLEHTNITKLASERWVGWIQDQCNFEDILRFAELVLSAKPVALGSLRRGDLSCNRKGGGGWRVVAGGGGGGGGWCGWVDGWWWWGGLVSGPASPAPCFLRRLLQRRPCSLAPRAAASNY
jgi:hypothetical protein